MPDDRLHILDDLIRQRWEGRFSVANYLYNASYVLSEVSLGEKKILYIGCGNGLPLCTMCLLSGPVFAVGMDNYQGEGSPQRDFQFLQEARGALSLPNL